MVSVKTYFTVGRDPKTFKFYDEFEEQLAKLDSAEIDVQVDESGQWVKLDFLCHLIIHILFSATENVYRSNAAPLKKRQRTKGRFGSSVEEEKLRLLRTEVEAKTAFLQQMAEMEREKLYLFKQLVENLKKWS